MNAHLFVATDEQPTNQNLYGYPVFTANYLTEVKHRSWRERLFTRPWRPFQRQRVVPKRKFYFDQVRGVFFCHPDFFNEMKWHAQYDGIPTGDIQGVM